MTVNLASENFLNLKSVSYKKEPIKDSVFGFTLVFIGIISVVFTCENDNFSHFWPKFVTDVDWIIEKNPWKIMKIHS